MKPLYRALGYFILALGILSNVALGLGVLAVAFLLVANGNWLGLVLWLFFGAGFVIFVADLVKWPFAVLAGVLIGASAPAEE